MRPNPSIRVSGAPTSSSRLVLRALLQAVALPLILSSFLFLPAGSLNWPMGWALLTAYVAGIFGTTLLVLKREPELAQERLSSHGPAERWDPFLTSAAKVLSIVVMPPLAGFDHRFNWSPPLAGWLQAAGLLLFGLSFVLIGWAMSVNKFFSAVVRIQEERGHVAVSGGPYRFVRHPGYAAMIIQFLAAPIALGSLWALAPGGLAAVVYMLRTILEDRTLIGKLPGYRQYARQVRYRLLPGIW